MPFPSCFILNVYTNFSAWCGGFRQEPTNFRHLKGFIWNSDSLRNLLHTLWSLFANAPNQFFATPQPPPKKSISGSLWDSGNSCSVSDKVHFRINDHFFFFPHVWNEADRPHAHQVEKNVVLENILQDVLQDLASHCIILANCLSFHWTSPNYQIH